ncbi:MAG: NAD(P)-binding protein, partial [Candidatus Sumerlaeota bacterium]|nr:NAD(P)-binding protein [Candidatus Sumerlaeota bacterium]
LPGVLGRICPAFCESPCGRRRVDEPLAIKALHRHAADADLASGEPYLPACKPATGKRVAIVGAGPAGLTAAFYLLRQGHACALFDAADRPGGLLRHIPAEQLEQDVVDGELGVIERLGAQLRMRWRLGVDGSLEQLRRDFDAVVLAIGAWAGGAGAIGAPDEKRTVDLELIRSQGLEVAKRGIAVDLAGATSREGVFAAGEAVFGPNYAVRAMAAGRNVAVAIDQFLRGETARGEPKPFYFHRGALPEQEEQVLYGGVVKAARLEAGAGGYGVAEAVQEAGRCLLCGCEKQDDCALRRYAAEYGANGNRFRGERRLLDPDDSHPDLAFETGKCILCGLCLKIAEQEGEPRGLAFSGRGFPTRVVVPFGGSFGDGVHASPARYAEACPTGAISWKEKPL